MPKQPEVLSTNPTTTEEATQSSQDVTPTQKANIDFSVSRKWKLPTLDENEKSDQKKNIEPKPKQTKLSSFYSKINWIMLDLCFFYRCDTDFPIFKWSIFLSCLFVYRYICLDQFSFCKVHVKIIEKTLCHKIKAIRASDPWIWYSILFIFLFIKKNKLHVVKSLVFKITREKFEVK